MQETQRETGTPFHRRRLRKDLVGWVYCPQAQKGSSLLFQGTKLSMLERTTTKRRKWTEATSLHNLREKNIVVLQV